MSVAFYLHVVRTTDKVINGHVEVECYFCNGDDAFAAAMVVNVAKCCIRYPNPFGALCLGYTSVVYQLPNSYFHFFACKHNLFHFVSSIQIVLKAFTN